MDMTDKIVEISKGKGITACQKTLPIKMGVQNYHLFGGKGEVALSDKKVSLINTFVKEILD